MLSRVHIFCFAACYSIALVLEVSRLVLGSNTWSAIRKCFPLLFRRNELRGSVMLAFAGAGWIAHTAYLYYRAVNTNGSPLSSSQDWYLVAAWVLVLVYGYLIGFHPKQHFGVFLLPLVLALIATAGWLADSQPFAREPASQVWGVIHAVSILLATVSVLMGFADGLMYLSQSRRLKGKWTLLAPLRLPSLEWLQKANSRAIVASTLLMGVGLLSGVVLNAIAERPLPWNDPVVLAMLGMFTWLLAAVLFSAVYRPARRGRKVAYLTVASVVFLAIALAMGLFMRTQHGGLRTEGQRRGARGEGRGEEAAGATTNLRSVPGLSASAASPPMHGLQAARGTRQSKIDEALATVERSPWAARPQERCGGDP
jgi:ABC-type uncharacterized transport system permease subunit